MASVVVGTTKHHLPRELALLLPREGVDYFTKLNDLRFVHRPESDHTFLDPNNMVSLLLRAFTHRGSLQGDDRLLMEMQGTPAEAFDLPKDKYSYLQVPIEGRLGSISIQELPEWVPVTAEETSKLPDYQMRDGSTNHGQLSFSVDSEFQRMINYATIIIAPNWFENPSSERSVLDVMVGSPAYGQYTMPVDHRGLQKAGISAGTQTTIGELRCISGADKLVLGCHLRNLPGRR